MFIAADLVGTSSQKHLRVVYIVRHSLIVLATILCDRKELYQVCFFSVDSVDVHNEKLLALCRYLQEYSALGTAGGMYHFRDQILTGNPDLFFVMNADVCGDFPLQEMLEFHQAVDSAPHFTILGTEVCALYHSRN